MTAVSWDRARGHASGYDVVELGFNHRLDEPRAALGLERLRRLDADTARRADARRPLPRRCSTGVVECCLAPAAGARTRRTIWSPCSSRPAPTARPSAPASPSRACRRASTTRPRTASRSTRTRAPELPVTDEYAARTITLPLFAHMTEEQQDLVVDAVAGAVAAPVA